MVAARHLFTLLLPLVVVSGACATGLELEQGAAALSESDGGPEASSIRAVTSSAADAAPTNAVDARPLVDADAPDADVPDTSVAPTPTTAACGSSPSYSLFIIALALSGTTPPACTGGTCATGECCYQSQYCLPQ